MSLDEPDPSPEVPPDHLRRVVVLGTTGSGKTTLARELSRRLDVTYVELDNLNWALNWTEAPHEEFRLRVYKATASDTWVVDGNYSKARDLVWPRATMLVWLDLPFPVVVWRLFWRTFARSVRKEKLWNARNQERLWVHFTSRDSLFWWALKTHWRRRRSIPEALMQPEHRHLKLVRLRSPASVRRWLAGVAAQGQTR